MKSHDVPGSDARPNVGIDYPPTTPAPVRSSDPAVQNTPSPGGPKYEGDAASQAAPSGSNPRRASNTSFVNTER